MDPGEENSRFWKQKVLSLAEHLSPNHTGNESWSQGLNQGLWTSKPGVESCTWLLHAHRELSIRQGFLLWSKV